MSLNISVIHCIFLLIDIASLLIFTVKLIQIIFILNFIRMGVGSIFTLLDVFGNP